MNLGLPRALLLGAAFVLLIAAIVAGTDTTNAAPYATGAAIAVVVFTLLSLGEVTRFTPRPFALPVSDPYLGLSAALREGPLGRQRVAAAIAELERETKGRRAVTVQEARAWRPEDQKPAEFRQWLGERLDELEGST